MWLHTMNMKDNLYSRMRKNSWGKDKFATICFTVFVAISVAMISLTVMLFVNLTGAIDRLMDIAKTPDYLQMHTGDFDEEKFVQFAEGQKEVTDYQILIFLNLDNSMINIGEESLLDSTQDNGLCVQGNGFDYMIDLSNALPVVEPGQVYVPVCYESVYGIKIGDVMKIGEEELNVAGFIRDSQMNSMMASSKRFLVCEQDYERLKYLGCEEYLIEFLLEDGADTNVFKTAYENAGLPMNGPTITGPLVKMMNILSDGIMIFIILLISVLVLVISLICIRFMLLTRVVSETMEVGVMKAVGISRKDIRSMFLGRYIALIIIGCVVGMIVSVLTFEPLSVQMQKLYGVSGSGAGRILFASLGAVIVGMMIVLFVLRVLRRLNDTTAVNALSGIINQRKRNKNKLCIAFVTAIAVFLMMIPSNLYSTLSSPKFVTYMGIGNADIRMDLRESDESGEKFKTLENFLAQDDVVAQYALYQTCSTPVRLNDGTTMNMLIEQGNHTCFPVTYNRGKAPAKEDEIALSYLLSEELGLYPGDSLSVSKNGTYQSCKVSGIYSDVTNGGKTAKIYVDNILESTVSDSQNVMWRIAYVTLKDEAASDSFIQKYSETGAEVVDIASRIIGTYGPTLKQIQRADLLVKLVACMIIFFVIMLFVRMLIASTRKQISMKKALGFKNADILNSFRKSCVWYIGAGVIVGATLGCTVGQIICGMALSSLGAVGFKFELNIIFILINIAVGSVTAMLAVYIGSIGIRNIKAVECCSGR